MGQALYRKYRSRSWDDVIGQEPIVTTLERSAASGKFSHAYLFSGPRGTGKTSVARLMARQINDIDYKNDEPHIDIIEIDAASNTGVDDIRDLREKVSVVPALSKYKVYIIDEVHMLSKSAFNALLKTLEEPPAHVVFILATTDPQKLPETIISRTQHFAFKPISLQDTVGRLSMIAKAEKIAVDDEAIKLIAELGEGSLRDCLSLLDQLAAGGARITLARVESLAGLAPTETIDKIKQSIDNHQPKDLVRNLTDSFSSGYRAEALANQLIDTYRRQIIIGVGVDKLPLIKQLMTISSSHLPERLLEIILLEESLAGADNTAATENPSNAGETKTNAAKTEPKPGQDKPRDNRTPDSSGKSPNPKHSTKIQANDPWPSVLDRLRGHHNTLYGIARMANASVANGSLILEFAYPFHLKRINEAKNMRILNTIVSEIGGKDLSIECRLNPSLTSNRPDISTNQASEPSSTPGGPDESLQTISNIFGNAELL